MLQELPLSLAHSCDALARKGNRGHAVLRRQCYDLTAMAVKEKIACGRERLDVS